MAATLPTVNVSGVQDLALGLAQPQLNPTAFGLTIPGSADHSQGYRLTRTPLIESDSDDALHLPDLTNLIRREGEYPAGRGGFADVWKGVLCNPTHERKVSGLSRSHLFIPTLSVVKVAVKVLQARTFDTKLEGKIAKVWRSI